MKRVRVLLVLAAAAALLGAGPARGETDPDFAASMKALVSRFESMGHGYRTPDEWRALIAHVVALADRAEARAEWDDLIELRLIEAMVYSDSLGEYNKALEILQSTRKDLATYNPPSMRKVYVREAEVYAKIGDEAAISRLIQEFKSSRFFDPENYSYTGGQGRNVPLVITRPRDRGEDSISVTAMETFRQQARYAPGRAATDFEAVDSQGVPFRLSDYRGKVVLVDFWLRGWEPWKRELPYLVQTYRNYNPYGFEIIGVNLDRDAGGVAEFMMANGAAWRQVVGNPAIARSFGIFGEAANFLVDPNGRIVGRNLRGSELVQAIRRTMGAR